MASRVLSCATAPMVSRVLSDSSRTTCCYPSLQKLRSSTSTSTSTVTVTKLRLRNGSIRCKALGESSQTFYQGIYGPWTVDSSDVREVHDFYFFLNLIYLLQYSSFLVCVWPCFSVPAQAVPSSILRLLVIRVKYFVGYLKWVSSFGSFALCFFSLLLMIML